MTQTRDETRPTSGQPEANAAQPCDEYCEPECVHHTAGVGWDLSFGSRINFHPRDTSDPRLVVSLHLSDDAIANGMVYREVTEQQVATFGQMLLGLTGGGMLADLTAEIDRQDQVHPSGYPATRDGVFLGIQTAIHELDPEAIYAWRDDRCPCKTPLCGHATWQKTRAEMLQAAAVIMRTIRSIDAHQPSQT